LSRALRTEFERAQEAGAARMAQAIDPYSRFVRAEQARWAEARQTLSGVRDRAASFRKRLAA
jgi:hypothetical protein